MNTLHKRVCVSGLLEFKTAFHIGSGREGDLATDMGVLKGVDGSPVLPGSTLKGNFRSFAERLAPHLGMSACQLDTALSGVSCVSDESYRKRVTGDFRKQKTDPERLKWLESHTCNICGLFGSPFQAGRIFFSDGILKQWSRTYEIRDGVCIDRDSETARYGAKYDFEIIPQGTSFEMNMEMENPRDKDLALVGAVLSEWEMGFRLGGFTSRGLGKVECTKVKVKQVDYSDMEQLMNYLLKRVMAPADNIFKTALNTRLQTVQAL